MRKISFVWMVLLLSFILVGCTNIASIGKQMVDITVISDGNETVFSLEVGKQATLDTYTKTGYYLDGIYDAESGGTEYFGSDSKSLGVWNKTNPTTFYTRWVSVSSLSHSTGKSYSIDPFVISKGYITTELSKEFRNAALGNLETNVTVTVSFRYDTHSQPFVTNYINVAVVDSKNSGSEKFGATTLTAETDGYVSYTNTFTIPARALASGNLYYFIDRNNTYVSIYMKDISFDISF